MLELSGLGYMEHKRRYSIELDSTDVQGRSLDKRIQFLIGKWHLEDAVDLVKRSASLSALPSGNTMVILLKRLTDVGDVENSIELTNILLEHHLVLKKNIFPHLIKAFYNSGEILDGIEYLELTYNATKKFEDIETLFTLIASLTFKVFPDKSEVIENFVQKCTEEDKYRALAHLWKCYMLAEQFEKADKLLEANKEELKSFLPIVINEICQMKDKVEVDREVVMSRLCEIANLSKKQRAYAYEMLLNILGELRYSKITLVP
jgi:tetratricopeptide (TPR) repeat protein